MGGASTSILMKRMRKYAEDKDFKLDIIAKGVSDYEEYYHDYDLILLGPQISYQKDSIKETTNLPIAVISPYDYALGNVESIFKQVEAIYRKK